LPPSSSSIPNRFPSSATENTKNIYIYLVGRIKVSCKYLYQKKIVHFIAKLANDQVPSSIVT